jgi:hypothetical protein
MATPQTIPLDGLKMEEQALQTSDVILGGNWDREMKEKVG